MLENVTRWLKKGGRFIGTIPNDKLLLYVILLISPMTLHPRPTFWTIYLTEIASMLCPRTRIQLIYHSVMMFTGFVSTTESAGLFSATGILSTSRTLWRMYRNTSSDGTTSFSEFATYLTPGFLYQICQYASSSSSAFLNDGLELTCRSLLRMASEYQLRLLYKAEFHDVYEEYCEHAEFGPLLQRMKVVDSAGNSQMDEEQWEAASESAIHLVFNVLLETYCASTFRYLCRFCFRENIIYAFRASPCFAGL